MKAVIIGGGLGGLSAAVHLASEGVDVKVFEKNSHFGGKMMAVDEEGYHFDFGPNTITMPEVFTRVLEKAGLPSHTLTFEKIETHTRNVFPNGTTFDFSTNPDVMKTQLKKLDPKGYQSYEKFLKEIERLYQMSRKHFLHRTFNGWKDYLSPSLMKSMMNVRPLQSMDRFFREYFSNPDIIQALNRYSTYIGSNPYKAPATFSMIAHLEWNDGVYYVKGGNTRIAESFVQAAEAAGVHLYSGTPVSKVHTYKGRAAGVETKDGDFFEADHVIINGDLLQAVPELIDQQERKKMSDQKLASYDPSISAFVIMAGLDTCLPQLHHHHLLFSGDYEKEFDQLSNGAYADDPTIYICTSAKSDPDVSPKGDNCFILVNAPAVSGHQQNKEHYKALVYDKLTKAGIPVQDHLVYEKIIGPEEIEETFGGSPRFALRPFVQQQKPGLYAPVQQVPGP